MNDAPPSAVSSGPNGKPVIITRSSLISVGLVVALLLAVWAVASDRQRVVVQVDQNTEAIKRMDKRMDYLTEAVHRIEVKLGTAPAAHDPEP